MMATVLLLAATAAPSLDSAYLSVEARYVHEFLSRYPVVSTYLGGAGLDPSLGAADGQLRAWSPAALAAESKTFAEIRGQLEKIDPARLTPAHRIDREVALHQIEFMRHWGQD